MIDTNGKIDDGNAKPQQYELMFRACQIAAPLVTNTSVTLGSALNAACAKLGIVLDDELYTLAIVSLGKFRGRAQNP